MSLNWNLTGSSLVLGAVCKKTKQKQNKNTVCFFMWSEDELVGFEAFVFFPPPAEFREA